MANWFFNLDHNINCSLPISSRLAVQQNMILWKIYSGQYSTVDGEPVIMCIDELGKSNLFHERMGD